MSDTGPWKYSLCLTITPLLADFDQHSKLGLVTCPSAIPLRNSQGHQQETDDTVVGGTSYSDAIAHPLHTLSETLTQPNGLRVVLLQSTDMLTNAICSNSHH